MRNLGKLAVIGSGPSALYLLKHLADASEVFRESLESIVVFERSTLAGYGMPYHPETTDRYNRSNISSEELPELPETFHDWLRGRNDEELVGWGIERSEISDSAIYCRLALGAFFHDQFATLLDRLRHQGVKVDLRLSCEVSDVKDLPEEKQVRLTTTAGESEIFDTVVIATGHGWPDDDKPEQGFYNSPWPIFKLMPAAGSYHDFPIGTLGASLSAFDVISSLSHRHGEFVHESGELVFRSFQGAENFQVVMHAAEGWLPHLQWDQVEPLREIYRHVTREHLMALRDNDGFLRLDTFFDRVCRPALRMAFTRDGMPSLVEMLENRDFDIRDFVREMSDRHDYRHPFEGMSKELRKARESVEKHRPIHWKETLDDLMYCLNYHAELMPAEDHLTLKKTVMPFLMNVIAAMPLQSAIELLALHDAGKVRLIEGMVTVENGKMDNGKTRVSVKDNGTERTFDYRMFVGCGGQGAMTTKDYPFTSLVKDGNVREARADFSNPDASDQIEEDERIVAGDRVKLRLGGIDLDEAFRLIGKDGDSNPRIHDIAFPHATGVRPYSYGLQACDANAGIVVQHWIRAVGSNERIQDDMEQASETTGTEGCCPSTVSQT